MKFRIYRSIRVESIKDVSMENIGISWCSDESVADDFSRQFNDDYIVVSAIVTEDQIDIAQTNAQWNSEHMGECEVVLKTGQDITIEFEGRKFEATTGYEDAWKDESRPEAEECESTEVINHLEAA
ncbi:MAG: hypothetical protein LC664_12930 [Flavobacteriales bacterium]|nr:hypothetical protein [Flavobacteriales bacterium]